MSLLIVVSLILFGLFLLLTEIIFIPGTTVFGVLGVLFCIVGIYFAFTNFGSSTGWQFLIGTLVAAGVLGFLGFRSGIWNKFANNEEISARFNEGILDGLQVGEVGTTVSTLKPIGKAEFHNRQYEVSTAGNYLDPGTPVTVVRINQNKVIVEKSK